MNTPVKCKKCLYGAKNYQGTSEVRRVLIELNWFELLPLNGTTEVLRPCPECNEPSLVKA